MSLAFKIAEYETLLKQQAELEKRQLDISVRIRVWEKRLELLTLPMGGIGSMSEVDQFIFENRDQLDESAENFLRSPYHTTTEVAEFMGVSKSTVERYHQRGQIIGRKVGKNWQWESVSVVRMFLDGNPEEKS